MTVAPQYRGKGLGKAVLRLLLDHPDVRAVSGVRLGTRDASSFYEREGFAHTDLAAQGIVEMGLRR